MLHDGASQDTNRPRLDRECRRHILVHNVELVLLPEHPPDHRHVLYDHIERHHTHRPDQTKHEPEHPEPVYRERLDHPEHVHVNINRGNERTQEVHHGRTRYRTQPCEHHVGNGKRHRYPGVARAAEEELLANRDGLGVDDEQDALEPTLALLEEVAESEGGLLPHLALDEVEVVALAVGAHREEAVLGDGAVQAVVEGDCLLSGQLEKR